ncbi:hypothetical protein QTG54_013963 [Skeletonema marinoi]|uniref:Uncharacterized protein n=1 Tax=Skeletonema marinoi TaxID=267567 RepID=A0AAD8XXC8_9STRA|nr:hypothetical protein QTG54_013963 [Skeletonema marinoi]
MRQDYAYYEDRAPTVKLEDITSSDLNAKLLRWIKVITQNGTKRFRLQLTVPKRPISAFMKETIWAGWVFPVKKLLQPKEKSLKEEEN